MTNVHRFNVGQIQCAAIEDSFIGGDARQFFPEVPPEQLRESYKLSASRVRIIPEDLSKLANRSS